MEQLVKQAENYLASVFERANTPNNERSKMAGFRTANNRQLALDRLVDEIQIWLEEDPSPAVEGCTLKRRYAEQDGRHDNLKSYAPNLYKPNVAFLVQVSDLNALKDLVVWYGEGAESFNINRKLLALAVDRTIRPLLIDQGLLEEDGGEGYHHHKVIPRASAALTRENLTADAGLAINEAIRASANLLSQYELSWPKTLVANYTGTDIGERVSDLLYGNDSDEARIDRFLNWGDIKNTESVGNGSQGFNPTIVSYLLCVSNPAKYAFCKPETYRAAVDALLGEQAREKNARKRILHATRFYKAVLKIFQEEHKLPFTDLMHVHIAFWVMKDPYEVGYPSWGELLGHKATAVTETSSMPNMVDLNTILYGPPGTGKTYATAAHAVTIIDGAAPSDRAKLMARYEQLRVAGRIEFITFHQSYSYEEFMEGIRPVLDGDGDTGGIRYELRDGIFKRLCRVAGSLVQDGVGADAADLTDANVWKLSLGNTLDESAYVYEECLRLKRIALGYGGDVDYADCKDFPAVRAKMLEHGFALEEHDYRPRAVNWFRNDMAIGDIVVVSDGNLKFRAIGRITGDYFYDENFEYRHGREVEWLRAFEESLPADQILTKRFSQMTLYSLGAGVLKTDALAQLLAGDELADGKTVLIIDEINRGNVSKVFGELITLLEPDKRIAREGNPGLKVRLPYSGEEFGIPDNLYVVGTMNTADRSLTHIDTALRRRFTFEEIMPKPELLGAITVAGEEIDLRALLTAINHRIEALADREHTLGHAYFMNGAGMLPGDQLPHIFEHKIIPLLKEYFFEDWSRIRTVLGDDRTDERGLQFVTQEEVDVNALRGAPRHVYRLNRDALGNPAAYLKIYED